MSGAPGTVVARGLRRRFGDTEAVAPFDLEVGPGGVTGLLGPNGSGKSTFLRMLVGLVRPDAGGATIDGVALRGDGTSVRRRCTYAPGEIGLYAEMSVREQIAWLLRGRRRPALARALAIAGELGLDLRRRVRALSHGMKRQVLFAAALAPDVPVRILDEPTEGLDPSKRGAVLERLRADAAGGTTVLLSSHHLAEVDALCDRFVFLNEGRMLADESRGELASRARRALFVGYDGAAAPADLADRLVACGAETARVGAAGASVLLRAPDPRPFLERLAAAPDLPAPTRIQFGSLSLRELYRDLYGVEGV